ncbi:MAG: alpha-glucuronidase [Bacteroidota bacterium]|nr:alpha-glucuronidase [Bacteroidota bacterium]
MFDPYNNHTCRSIVTLVLAILFNSWSVQATDGHDLWLTQQSSTAINVVCQARISPTLAIAVKELTNGWQGPKGATMTLKISNDNSLKKDGFRLNPTEVHANTELGILYGVYELLRRQQTKQPVHDIVSNPSYMYRILNHWDNPDGTVERGYAGHSIFWKGKDHLEVTADDKRLWRDYARANASIGINGAVLNNVNASPDILSASMLNRAAAIAKELRPYGIQVYLSINFSSPVLLGHLSTSDPLDKNVMAWWDTKVREIYRLIPDFGGFLVKANSEGSPGPQDYGRTHADGANMLADILKPYGGLVMWRAFVYRANDNDRAKQAYTEFIPLDGQFHDNVIIQVKNGPIDFQPREPFSPLFGAMKRTPVMPELQITQEYLGQRHQLVFLAPLWKECLQSDTYQQGPGSTVARCTDGSLYRHRYSAIAGVANIGLDQNWCGNTFAQANWYAFGRLAWNDSLSSRQIADEWLRLTFRSATAGFSEEGWTKNFLSPVRHILLQSRESAVSYMMPLGLHHLFAGNHHYGPGPWYAPKGVRPDWTPPYYHQADSAGIGFDRSSKGSLAVAQYHEPLQSQFDNPDVCPETLLLWFHHLPWTYRMKNGQTLWDELCRLYDRGVKEIRDDQKSWDQVQSYIDAARFTEVKNELWRQEKDAQVWKDGCILYFQSFSRLSLPPDVEPPVYKLENLMKADMLQINNVLPFSAEETLRKDTNENAQTGVPINTYQK